MAQFSFRRIFFPLLFAVSFGLSNPASASEAQAQGFNAQLYHATERGDLAAMRALLGRGADASFSHTNSVGQPLLLVATIARNPRAVALLLEHHANANARDARGTPILVTASSFVTSNAAASKPYLDCIRLLLKKGHANPNAVDAAYVGDARGALHLAAASGSIELAELLIAHGADVNLIDHYGENALYFAAERGQLAMAKFLVSHGAKKDLRTKFTRMSPLMAAAEKGHADVVRYLVGLNVDLLTPDTFGKTPLLRAKGAETARIIAQALQARRGA